MICILYRGAVRARKNEKDGAEFGWRRILNLESIGREKHSLSMQWNHDFLPENDFCSSVRIFFVIFKNLVDVFGGGV